MRITKTLIRKVLFSGAFMVIDIGKCKWVNPFDVVRCHERTIENMLQD